MGRRRAAAVAALPRCAIVLTRMMPCRLCCVLLVVVVAAAAAANSAGSASGRWVVTTLPGFDGPLPFHLETGYVEVDEDAGAELFYYFIRSESGVDAPLVLWVSGGQRCSGLSGLGYEIGPVRFVAEPYNGTLPRLRFDPNSWTKATAAAGGQYKWNHSSGSCPETACGNGGRLR